MKRRRLINGLLTAGTIAMLLVAIGAATIWLKPQKRGVSTGDAVGDKLHDPGGWTAVAVVSSSCAYCTASMPFYRDVLALKEGITFVVAGSEAPDALRSYCESHGVRARRYESIARTELDVRGTPTLLLIDPGGVVRGVWRGRLSAQGERTVEAALKRVP